MATKEYFRLRYRRSLIVLAIVWGLASPVIIFDEWWVPRRYEQYVQRVTHPPAAGLVDFTGKKLPEGASVVSHPRTAVAGSVPIPSGATIDGGPAVKAPAKPDLSKWKFEPVDPQDVDETNLDNSPLELESWEKSQVGHPRYYSTVAALEPCAWGMAVVGSLPWLWYFLLVRITEIASAFRGDATSPTEKTKP
ncbi:MAG: hypothetical protein WBE69_15870 [Candidatus Binataceae bacterium]|jgi:hypothetical protein